MGSFEYGVLCQLVITIFIQIFVTFPCIFVILRFYLDNKYSLVLKAFFWFSLIYAFATIANSSYLIVFWSPNGAIYDRRAMAILGTFSLEIQNIFYISEFFLGLERCLAILLKLNYTKRVKLFIGIFAIVACPAIVVSMHWIDGMPFIEPSAPTKCQFYGCLLNESNLNFTYTIIIGNINSFSNIGCALLLMLLVYFKKKDGNLQIKNVYKGTVITILLTTFLKLFPSFVAVLAPTILNIQLAEYMGPIRYTLSAFIVPITSFIYWQSFRDRQIKPKTMARVVNIS